jgi:hypothetical protein
MKKSNVLGRWLIEGGQLETGSLAELGDDSFITMQVESLLKPLAFAIQVR